jgi:hypothetical protein
MSDIELRKQHTTEIVSTKSYQVDVEHKKPFVWKSPVLWASYAPIMSSSVVGLILMGISSSIAGVFGSSAADPYTLALGVSIAAGSSIAAILSPIAYYRSRKTRKQAYDVINPELVHWMKNAYNLDISLKTAQGLNRFYLIEEQTKRCNYPYFTDSKGKEYKLIKNTSDDKTDEYFVVSKDYDDQVIERTALAKSELLSTLAPTQFAIEHTKTYTLSSEQQEMYDMVNTCYAALEECDLDNEDTYVLNRVKSDMSKVLELHEKALSLDPASYAKSNTTLNQLLEQFLNELNSLSSKQATKAMQGMQSQYTFMLTK